MMPDLYLEVTDMEIIENGQIIKNGFEKQDGGRIRVVVLDYSEPAATRERESKIVSSRSAERLLELARIRAVRF